MLYIQLENGVPVGHPILEQNLLDAFELASITTDWLAANSFARFERLDSPAVIGAGHPTYVLQDDGVVRPIYAAAELTQEQKIDNWIRKPRRALLASSDWTQLADAPLTAEEKAAWAAVRQQLRDLPDTYADVQNIQDIVFPTSPTPVK